MIRKTLPFATLLTILGASAVAAAALSATGTPSVKFMAKGKAVGMVGVDVAGSSSNLKVSEKDGKVTVTVPLASLATGIEMRDEHMKNKYLEIKKFPTATLVIDRSALQFPSGAPVKGSVSGQFTLHGETRTKTLAYTATPANGGIRVTSGFNVNILEHKIQKPEEYGVKIEPDVRVDVEFTVKD